MKIAIATGLLLALCVGACRTSAEELQWRAAPGAPTLVRAKNDEDAKPLPSGTFSPVPLPMSSAEDLATPAPQPAPMPVPRAAFKSAQKSKVIPMPLGEPIPTSPTPIIESNTVPPGDYLGSEVVVDSGMPISSGGCNCGLKHSAILGDTIVEGCGDCLTGGTCGTCVSDACCQKSCCLSDCCCYNSNRNHLWVSAEYLLFKFSRPNTPPLVTGGPVPPGVVLTGPALADPTTQVLYGGSGGLNNDLHSGGRFTFGFWFPECCNWGAEFSGLFLAKNTTSFTANSGYLGRPYQDVTGGFPGVSTAELVNDPVPGGVNGSVRVDYSSRAWGLEANLLYKLCCGPNWRLNLLFGYRNFQLDENISITENLSAGGTPINVYDSFSTHNSFNGGQVGLEGEFRFCKCFFVGGFIKVAVGDVYQSVNISGTGLNISGLGPNATGIFANSSNIGNYSRNQLGVLPEACLKIGWDITDNLRVFVGYNFLYLSSVQRPGDAIDPTINVNNIVNNTISAPARPSFVFSNSTFWAQGITAGLEYHY
jgi:hypothetical protein